ncbi:harpin-induced protein 1 domain containing protein [Musa troglodytarum]|uniref:Harpin-induced protein 1 domain containing protein n=1 Tax=Musa troglodytarum TaxID=320322 RepID=A0A9E7ELF6_9LILI|nr:harpin-induced protein 1 domain containing protein [Musa troglodytarum]
MQGEQGAGHSPHHQPARTAKLIVRPQASPPTHPVAWFAAAFCTLLWVAIILGGLAVLVVYLVFRPRNPRLEISSVTLNGAYVDAAGTLNADLTILANFSNPNEKAYVSFGYMQLDLYYRGTMIATQAVEPFEEGRGESVLRTVHMISSQVPLPGKAADALRAGAAGEGLSMEVVGSFRTRLDLGSWLHYTYWLHGRCRFFVGAPPNGSLRSSRCTTKH